ncbi:MAG: hypothetical protein ACE5EG_10770 [Thermoanaerobaculia bacterium]
MAVRRPWSEGLRLAPGSGKLMTLRWLLFVAAALPGLATGIGDIGESLANRPYFAEAPDPLPLLPLFRMLGRLPGSVWGMLGLAAVVAWLGNLLLTAGAVAIFGTARGDRPLVWRTIFEAGTRSLWAYLRIALTALVLAALGARLIGAISDQLMDHATAALWTLHSKFLLQVARGLATLCWLTLVGVFAWWCRVILVADERRRVRRLWTVVPRLWRRRPLAALVGHFLLALAALLAGTGVIVAWRQSTAGALGWSLLWLLVLAGLSFLWHWRLRAGRLLWSSPELLDLRAVPDAPWGLPRRVLVRLRRRTRKSAVATTESAGS